MGTTTFTTSRTLVTLVAELSVVPVGLGNAVAVLQLPVTSASRSTPPVMGTRAYAKSLPESVVCLRIVELRPSNEIDSYKAHTAVL
jgi:hypothetical protein